MLQDTVKLSHEVYVLVIAAFKDLYLQASKVAYGEEATNEDISNPIEIEQGYIGDPCVAKMKGRSRVGSTGSNNGRYKGGFERAMEKVRSCRGCGEIGHDKRNCATKSSKKL
ncbi:unnamed protein product [Cuscuta campestris]|uniref:CCHC-type domain-containing protein n=1 Tax=Cuscuta campestris TaxID=132261 RepID=A0A484MWH6_9ASTE|nr:unnamed protein product [Cuscuta campestris]